LVKQKQIDDHLVPDVCGKAGEKICSLTKIFSRTAHSRELASRIETMQCVKCHKLNLKLVVVWLFW